MIKWCCSFHVAWGFFGWLFFFFFLLCEQAGFCFHSFVSAISLDSQQICLFWSRALSLSPLLLLIHQRRKITLQEQRLQQSFPIPVVNNLFFFFFSPTNWDCSLPWTWKSIYFYLRRSGYNSNLCNCPVKIFTFLCLLCIQEYWDWQPS